MRLTIVLLGVLLVGVPSRLAAQMGEEQIGIARGTVAEGAVVETLEGEAFDLGDYVGKQAVLLEFWATWCENCEALLPSLISAYERHGDEVAFLAVAVGVGQSPRSIERHLRRHPQPFLTLFDKRGAAVRAFQTPATSHIVVLDVAGVVRYTGIGPDQDIEAAIRTAVGSGR